jgi:hypothetical protein
MFTVEPPDFPFGQIDGRNCRGSPLLLFHCQMASSRCMLSRHEKGRTMWTWLRDPDNRGVLILIGGAIAGLASAFAYFDGKTWLQNQFRQEATYYLCMGTNKASCGSTDWVPCGTDMQAHVKAAHPDMCVYIKPTKLSDPGGNGCGYATYKYECSTKP